VLFPGTLQELARLMDAGVDSLPGGGAEIFNERVRRIICDHKIDGAQWLEVARTAHQLGLKSNCTMLYGHIENEERFIPPTRRWNMSRQPRDFWISR